VEVVSGKKLGEFFEAHIFKPLKMKDSAFHVAKAKIPRFTVTYTWADKKRNVSDHPSRSRFIRPAVWESGGGGLTSTTQDYLRFCQMLLNGGKLGKVRLLKESSVQQMNLSAKGVKGVPMGGNAEFGLGFRVLLEKNRQGMSQGSYNWGGYASTTFQIDPANNLILIGMTQKVPTDNGFTEGFKSAVYSAIKKK
jgi:CubicO group peptidase (beta-lactamase class C family)